MPERTHGFEDFDELFEAVEKLPEASRHLVYGYNPEIDEWKEMPWRDSVWLEDGRMVGDISTNHKHYNVIQYGEVLEAAGTSLQSFPDIVIVGGHVTVSPSGHKMTGQIDLSGDLKIEPTQGDIMKPQIRLSTAHTRHQRVRYDLGAIRPVCANGMVGFVKDIAIGQSHQKPLDFKLPKKFLEKLEYGVEEAEKNLSEALDRYFYNLEESLLVLGSLGIHEYIPEDSFDALSEGLEEEMDGEIPSLYDTYNAATRTLTHETEGIPEYRVETGLDDAGCLIEYKGRGVPDTEYLGKRAVGKRHREIEQGDDELFEGEKEVILELKEDYNIQFG